MTREQMLIDALHDVVSAESWSDAVQAASRTIDALASEGEPAPTRYGVASSSAIIVADSPEDALAIAKKRCQREPGLIVSVVAVQSNFAGKVQVEELI